MEKIADRNSWKTQPLPAQRVKLNIERTFTDQEYSLISKGLIPEQMEDKWFIFMENDILFLHRSWTGFCIYEVHFDSQHAIRAVWANRNRDQHTQTNDEHDGANLIYLIEYFLLGKRKFN